jgi:hypothetical protein
VETFSHREQARLLHQRTAIWHAQVRTFPSIKDGIYIFPGILTLSRKQHGAMWRTQSIEPFLEWNCWAVIQPGTPQLDFLRMLRVSSRSRISCVWRDDSHSITSVGIILASSRGFITTALSSTIQLNSGLRSNSLTCSYREGTTGRALPNGVTTPGGSALMTVALCTSSCQAAGYLLAGVEYSGECCTALISSLKSVGGSLTNY